MRGDHPQMARRLLVYGVTAVSSALIGALTWHLGKDVAAALLNDPDATTHVRAFLNPRGKRPPSPAYLAFYGGLSLVVLAAFFHGKPAGLVRPIVRVTSVIGRASLMCFIVQDWLFFAFPRAARFDGIQSVGFWLIYLGAATVTLHALSQLWGHLQGNRFLTVGLKALTRRRHASAPDAANKRPRPHLF
jgi:hypothetical protein